MSRFRASWDHQGRTQLAYYLAADTGGTFTDVVSYNRRDNSVRFGKVLTTYGNLVDGVLEGSAGMGVPFEALEIVKHGTTHIINAFIQRRGAKTALVTNKGFRDVLEIGRANRPISFDLRYERNAPLVPRTQVYEIGGRIGADGREVEAIDEAEILALAERLVTEGFEAVAVSLLNSYGNTAHEDRVADLLAKALPDAFVTTGSRLSREWYEYERASTSVANAYVGPRARDYLQRFSEAFTRSGFSKTFYMMASNGGVLSLDRSSEQPVALLESGPVGGCIGAGVYSRALGLGKVIAFDMGGTTAKCAIVDNGKFEVQPTYYIGGYERGFPVRAPILDIVEVGAGGGSIASVDRHGRLSVGPRSAGSEPGPVAFGRGGVEPTVTDANLVLGRISGGRFLGGSLKLDVEASRRAILEKVASPLGFDHPDQLDIAANGILEIAATTMAGAIKEITIERGLDAREFDLFVFGGGGPLHSSKLARELHIPKVIVPLHPGNFSALGMLLAASRLDDTRTFLRALGEAEVSEMLATYREMEGSLMEALKSEAGQADVMFERTAEIRYRGQKHSLRVDIGQRSTVRELLEVFHEAYHRRYGHSDHNASAEFVSLRSTGYAGGESIDLAGLFSHSGQAPETHTRMVYYASLGSRVPATVYDRPDLPIGFGGEGPAIIEDFGSTIVLEPGDRFEVGRLGEINIYCPQA